MRFFRQNEKNHYSKQPFQAQFFKRDVDQDDCWTLLTNQIMLNYKYVFPYQKIYNYVQRYQKYKLRAALSSIPISMENFQTYYNSIIKKSLENEKIYVLKAITMISDLFNLINSAKIEQIRIASSIFQGFRLTCLQKNLDPYDFKVKQFDSDLQKVLKYLGDAQLAIQKSQLQNIKKQVIQMTQKLKKKQKQKMDSMINCQVKHPYLSQNKSLQILNCQKLFESYVKSVKIKNKLLEDKLYRKYCQIHKSINQFGYNCKQYNLQCQKNASFFIQNYNHLLTSQDRNDFNFDKNQISKPIFLMKVKKYNDADDINKTWIQRSQARPCLINKRQFVQINQLALFYNIQKKQEIKLQINLKQELFKEANENQKQITYDKDCNPFNYIAQRKNKKILQYTANNQRLKPQSKNQSIQKNLQLQRYHNLKKINRFPKYQVKFQASQSSKIFKALFQIGKNEQKLIWFPHKHKQQLKISTVYCLEKNKSAKLQQNCLELTSEEEQIYEQKRREQQKKRLKRLQKVIKDRTYKKFGELNMNPKTKKPMFSLQYNCTQHKIFRYGIQLSINLKENSIQHFNKFFFYYFKERYYKQNQQVQENKNIPIFMSQQNRSDFLSDVVIKRIVTLFNSYNFFILWANDLIIYQQTKSFQDVFGHFTIVSYQSQLYSQKIMFELRKKIGKTNKRITETINTKFIQKQMNKIQDPFDQIFSKIQIVKRILYESHYEPKTAKKSVQKGKEIAQNIIQSLIENDC